MIEGLVPAEIQIDNKGIIEYNYRADGLNPEIWRIKQRIQDSIPGSENDFDYSQALIGYHPRDGVTYLNETAVVVYDVPPDEFIRVKYSIPDIANMGPGFGVKYDLTEGVGIAKVLDMDMWRHPIPALPKGCAITPHFGIGINCTDDDRRFYNDVYFLNYDRAAMQEFFGRLYPHYDDPTEPELRQYGITFDNRTLEPVKIKRYLAPGHWTPETYGSRWSK